MPSSAPTVGFVSLGCPKALVDSERILTQLRSDGYAVVPTYDDADIVVVNTCGFIDAAVEESLGAIGEALDENGRVVVTGCLGVKPDEIRARYPKVLAITGPQAYESVVAAVHQHAPNRAPHDPFVDLVPPQGVKLTPRHYAYLKISEGCDHKCSFCIIPSMRGRLASREIGDVLGEAERLRDAGVRELLVISQDTSAYGADLRYRTGFHGGRPVRAKFLDLCRELGELGIWVRLHYVYPYPHVDHVMPLMADGKLLPYLDIPFQHASRTVLKAMRRPAAAEDTLERIAAWRSIVPELAVRSTFITGFPGETDADFETLLDWLAEARLDRVGCFTYSPVEGAAANALPDPVPADVAEERKARLMALQAEISAERLAARVGRREVVVVDEVNVSLDGDDVDGSEGEGGDEPRNGFAIARSYADAPEIDGVVRVPMDGWDLSPGDLVEVEITGSDAHDLDAVVPDD